MQPDVLRLASSGADRDEAEIVDALRESVRRWSTERIVSREIEHSRRVPQALFDDMAELGLFGLSLPEAHGGAGLSLQGVCSVVAELAARDRSVATSLGLHLGLGTRGLVRYGSEAQRARFLPLLAQGKPIAAFAATESAAGSDLMAIATRGRRVGDHLELDGGKIFVTNGGYAGLFTIVAATPGLGDAKRGHSLVLVQPGDPGFTVGPEEDKLGIKGSSTTTLSFDGARVPGDRLVGEPGRGMEYLAHILAWGRTAMSAGCVGTGRAALDAAVRQVTERRQFRRTLASFDVVKAQVADLAARLYAMEALVRYTTAAEADDALLATRSTAAKVFCSEGAWELCDTSLQLHGGYGFIEETGVPRLLRDIRITRIFEGANDVLLVHAGTGEAFAAAPRLPVVERTLDDPLARRADALHVRIRAHVGDLLTAHGVRLMRHQRRIHGIGRLAVLRDATDAASLRALVEGSTGARSLATRWLTLAEARVDDLLRPPTEEASVDEIASSLLGGAA